jgi:phenylalanine-4-hydroxylase
MLQQQYDNYVPADHLVWELLYNRQMKKVSNVAYQNFSRGLELLKFSEHSIPVFHEINVRLFYFNGWQVYPVPGLIDNRLFFERMHKKEFGATTWIRKIEELDYLEEPDMFHDVFGHIPLLTDAAITEFLSCLAETAVKHIENEEIVEAIARLYWYTVEFGLVKEDGEIKIYGAGILSSIGETDYCLSDEATRVPFDLKEILQTPYIKDKYQEKYFVLESMEQLREAGEQLEQAIKALFKEVTV